MKMIAERIDKIQKIDDFLLGIELVLTEFNKDRFPSQDLQHALGHICNARRGIKRELSKLGKKR